jgi:hypothetical protein
MLASARMLHALVAEKLMRGSGSTGAACGDDGELLGASMQRALLRRGARARRGALCRGGGHVSKRRWSCTKVELVLVERGVEMRLSGRGTSGRGRATPCSGRSGQAARRAVALHPGVGHVVRWACAFNVRWGADRPGLVLDSTLYPRHARARRVPARLQRRSSAALGEVCPVLVHILCGHSTQYHATSLGNITPLKIPRTRKRLALVPIPAQLPPTVLYL